MVQWIVFLVFVYGAAVGITMFTIGFLTCYVKTMHQQQMFYETRLPRLSRSRQNKRHSQSSMVPRHSYSLDASFPMPFSNDSHLSFPNNTSRKRSCVVTSDAPHLAPSFSTSLAADRFGYKTTQQVVFQDNDSNDGDEDDATTSSI